jgi:hypothetical protein
VKKQWKRNEVIMDRVGRRMVVVLMLVLAAAALSPAQQRNVSYATGSLANVPAESVVVDQIGISPQSGITRSVGPFLLCIWNRRGNNTEHFSLTLDTAGAAQILSLDTSPQKFHGSVLVDLQPGKYRLRLTNSPGLSVPIVIQ